MSPSCSPLLPVALPLPTLPSRRSSGVEKLLEKKNQSDCWDDDDDDDDDDDGVEKLLKKKIIDLIVGMMKMATP